MGYITRVNFNILGLYWLDKFVPKLTPHHTQQVDFSASHSSSRVKNSIVQIIMRKLTAIKYPGTEGVVVASICGEDSTSNQFIHAILTLSVTVAEVGQTTKSDDLKLLPQPFDSPCIAKGCQWTTGESGAIVNLLRAMETPDTSQSFLPTYCLNELKG
uniref:Uncharacterized protein n=1 Tax=Echinococcus canadensis TaxID=519352 RepID=A0A915EZ56_9CEST